MAGKSMRWKDGYLYVINEDGTEHCTGATHAFTLNKLKKLQFYVDQDHFKFAFDIMWHGNKERWSKIHYRVREVIKEIIRGNRKRLRAETLVKLERATGIPADFFVDELRYYERNKIAGYRALFEAYRQGVSLEDLTDHPKFKVKHGIWYEYWLRFFKGRLADTTSVQYACAILQMCNRKLGIQLCDLLRPPAKLVQNADGVALDLYEMMVLLDKTDMSFVAGTVKALCDCKLNGVDLDESMKRLLEWYHGHKRDYCGS